ncbi:hypothetical protein BsWGS_16461 [Bradybaena similaris]
MKSMRNLQSLLLMGITCTVLTMAHVCQYNDMTCECIDTIYVKCRNVTEIPPFDTSINGNNVTDLTFQDGNIISMSRSSLPPGLTSITLINLPLSNISDDTFDESSTTLTDVVIIGAKFNNLPTALQKLTNLKELHLTDTSIHIWDTATLKQIASTLMDLKLYNVSLSAWPSWISDFHLLRTLDLSYNSINHIPDDAFVSIKDSLIQLDLQNTGLTHVPQALSSLSSLKTLDLSFNRFKDASTIDRINAFPFAHELYNLFLDSTGLTRIANFSNLTGLGVISLSGNRISDIPVGLFPASVITLYLTHNGLSSVPKAVASMPSLISLLLSSNRITHIEPDSFPASLTYLDLSFNNLTIVTNTISDIPDGLFPTSLTVLYLSHNCLSSVPKAVASIQSLEDLRLSSNRITHIEPNSFPSSLSNLDLRFNNLTVITNTTFRHLYNLNTLNLDSNPITTISPSAFGDLESMFSISINETHLREFPLALMQLQFSAIYFSITQPLSCPCPAPHDLVQWFNSLITPPVIEGNCSNGQSIVSYLRGQCVQLTAAL